VCTSVITIIAIPPTPQAEFVTDCGGRGQAEFVIIIITESDHYSFLDGVAFCKLLLTARGYKIQVEWDHHFIFS